MNLKSIYPFSRKQAVTTLQDSESLKKTPLHDHHRALKAKMVNFTGWSMPVFYSGIIAEHHWVRNSCGLFDVSHLGQIRVKGAGAFQFLQYRITSDMNKLSDGKIIYGLLCDERGFTLDDLLIYQINHDDYYVIVNAANLAVDYEAFSKYVPANVSLINDSSERGCLAIQGPKSESILEKILGLRLKNINYYHFTESKLGASQTALISRSGYTGEDGFELFAPNELIVNVWERLMSAAKSEGVLPIGLGARNTLRLEAGNALYGNDLDSTTTPLEAGLAWAVSFDKGGFVGRDMLIRQKKTGPRRKLAGFKMLGRAIAREHYPIFKDNKKIGVVTSGSFGPTVGHNIGLAYVEIGQEFFGNRLQIEVYGALEDAEIIKRPFVPSKHKIVNGFKLIERMS